MINVSHALPVNIEQIQVKDFLPLGLVLANLGTMMLIIAILLTQMILVYNASPPVLNVLIKSVLVLILQPLQTVLIAGTQILEENFLMEILDSIQIIY